MRSRNELTAAVLPDNHRYTADVLVALPQSPWSCYPGRTT